MTPALALALPAPALDLEFVVQVLEVLEFGVQVLEVLQFGVQVLEFPRKTKARSLKAGEAASLRLRGLCWTRSLKCSNA